MKNGSLICEEYFYGYTRDDLHQIESTTKSITSLLTGIAIDKGLISDLNGPLYEIFPEYDHLRKGAYRHIKLSHLLSMTSGFSQPPISANHSGSLKWCRVTIGTIPRDFSPISISR